MANVNYFELEQFIGLYLEDSFVLQIIETTESVSFKMEFVLTEDHPLFSPPKDGEAYCYQFGTIDFAELIKVKWVSKNEKLISVDANGDNDLGNIDLFYKIGEDYFLEGDWGKVVISCKTLKVELQNQSLS